MSERKESVNTIYGVITYTIGICDVCNKEYLNQHFHRWFYIRMFFEQYLYIDAIVNSHPNFDKIACSFPCLRTLFDEVFPIFEQLYTEYHSK